MDKLDEYRDQWNAEYLAFSEFYEQFEIPEEFISELVERGDSTGIAYKEKQLEISLDWLKLQMKALIARNLWSTSEYYQTLNPAIPLFQKVKRVINNDDLYSEVFENGN